MEILFPNKTIPNIRKHKDNNNIYKGESEGRSNGSPSSSSLSSMNTNMD